MVKMSPLCRIIFNFSLSLFLSLSSFLFSLCFLYRYYSHVVVYKTKLGLRKFCGIPRFVRGSSMVPWYLCHLSTILSPITIAIMLMIPCLIEHPFAAIRLAEFRFYGCVKCVWHRNNEHLDQPISNYFVWTEMRFTSRAYNGLLYCTQPLTCQLTIHEVVLLPVYHSASRWQLTDFKLAAYCWPSIPRMQAVIALAVSTLLAEHVSQWFHNNIVN